MANTMTMMMMMDIKQKQHRIMIIWVVSLLTGTTAHT